MKVVHLILRGLTLLAICGLTVLSVNVWQTNRNELKTLEDAGRRFNLDQRRSEVFETLQYVPSSDLGANVLADAILNDSLGEVSLRDMSVERRHLWLRALMRIDEELEVGRDLLLDAASFRPGWPYHWSLLGQVEYVRWRREGMFKRTAEEGWVEPLRMASIYAPGDVINWTFLASAHLESGALTEKSRRDTRGALRHALFDSEFVQKDFLAAYSVFGKSVFDLLPPEPRPVGVALRAMEGSFPSESAELQRRWETLERVARGRDLVLIRHREQLGDVEGMRSACGAWLSNHPVDEFADQAATRQLAELVAICPADVQGEWTHDIRNRLLLRFLDDRTAEVDGEALSRLAGALSGVPASVQARAELRGGDIPEALRLQHDDGASGTFEWTPFVLDLTRHYLAVRDLDRARRAIAGLSAAAAEECDSEIVRRDIATMAGDDLHAATSTGSRLASAWHRGAGATEWRRGSSLALCLADRPSRIAVQVRSERPGLVDFGWDGRRAGTACAGNVEFTSPVVLAEGTHSFFVRSREGVPLMWSMRLR